MNEPEQHKWVGQSSDKDVFDNELDLLCVTDKALTLEEIHAVHRLRQGTVPDECPYCDDNSMYWSVKFRKYESGVVEGHVSCANCDTDILEEVGLDPEVFVPDDVSKTFFSKFEL